MVSHLEFTQANINFVKKKLSRQEDDVLVGLANRSAQKNLGVVGEVKNLKVIHSCRVRDNGVGVLVCFAVPKAEVDTLLKSHEEYDPKDVINLIFRT